MACEETDPSCYYVPQISQPFLWSEEAHSLYLSFLEDAFVNDLYHRHYCALDLCGHCPPFASPTTASSIPARCHSPAPPQPPTTPRLSPSQPASIVESKACRKRSRTGSKGGATKRKGKWLSQDEVFDNHLACEPVPGHDQYVLSLEQPGSSVQSSENSECLVPSRPHGNTKRACAKGVDVRLCGTERKGTDQVVPLVIEED